MEYRHLGRSGLKVSEIAYGNWITHGSQVEEDAARTCVAGGARRGHHDLRHRRRLRRDAGRGGARAARCTASGASRWRSSPRCTGRPGPGRTTAGLSRKHIMESAHASLRRLQTDYVDLYQAHRYDHETPLEETLRAFDDLVRQGKVLYVGVSEWRAEEIAAALRDRRRDGPRPDRLQPAAVQHDLAGHRGRGRPAVREGGHRPDRLVTDRAGRADRQVPARRRGRRPARGPPTRAGPPSSSDYLTDAILGRVQQLRPVADEAGLTPGRSWRSRGCCRTRTCPRPSSARPGPSRCGRTSSAAGVRLDPDLMSRIDEILGPEIERDPALTASPAEPCPEPGVSRPGCRLIGPYSVLLSSSSVTWSTPASSSPRQLLAEPGLSVTLAAEGLLRQVPGRGRRPVRLLEPPGPGHVVAASSVYAQDTP